MKHYRIIFIATFLIYSYDLVDAQIQTISLPTQTCIADACVVSGNVKSNINLDLTKYETTTIDSITYYMFTEAQLEDLQLELEGFTKFEEVKDTLKSKSQQECKYKISEKQLEAYLKQRGFINNNGKFEKTTSEDQIVIDPITIATQPSTGVFTASMQDFISIKETELLIGLAGELDIKDGFGSFFKDGIVNSDGRINMTLGIRLDSIMHKLFKNKQSQFKSRFLKASESNYSIIYVSGGPSFSKINNYVNDPSKNLKIEDRSHTYGVTQFGFNYVNHCQKENMGLDFFIGMSYEMGKQDNSSGLDKITLITDNMNDGDSQSYQATIDVLTGDLQIVKYGRYSLDMIVTSPRLPQVGLYLNVGNSSFFNNATGISTGKSIYNGNVGIVLMASEKHSITKQRVLNPKVSILLGREDLSIRKGFNFGVAFNFGFGKYNLPNGFSQSSSQIKA